MSRKLIITIVVGLLILAITYVAFNAIFNAMAPSVAEIMSATTRAELNAILEKSNRAGGVRTLFYFVAGLEVIITGVLAFKAARE